MVYPRMRAWVSGTLFVLWLGFLAFLAFASRGRIVVARPQLERSNLVVLAALTEEDGRPAARIKIQKVLYAEQAEWQQLAGMVLDLKELAFFSVKQGWDGPGDYVVPLTHSAETVVVRDEVTLLPLSPGYSPATWEVKMAVGKAPERLFRGIAELTGTPSRRLRELYDGSDIRLWHVPLRTDDELAIFNRALHESDSKVFARSPAESRIYRATPDVLEQVAATIR